MYEGRKRKMKSKHNNFVVFLDVDGVLNTRTTCQRTPDGYTGIDDARVVILVLHCVNSSEYAPAVYVICKPHETRRSTTTPSFRGIHI